VNILYPLRMVLWDSKSNWHGNYLPFNVINTVIIFFFFLFFSLDKIEDFISKYNRALKSPKHGFWNFVKFKTSKKKTLFLQYWSMNFSHALGLHFQPFLLLGYFLDRVSCVSLGAAWISVHLPEASLGSGSWGHMHAPPWPAYLLR
jgi:hypothetical protein